MSSGTSTFNASLSLVAHVYPPTVPGGMYRWSLANGTNILAYGDTHQRTIAVQQAAAAMAARA